MEREAFKTFVEKKTNESKRVEQIDWGARKDEWLVELGNFYSIIEGYLSEFSKAGKIKIERSTVFLNEESIGRYQAESRIIRIGLDKVNLAPVGTLLIGAKGRVDMAGPRGTVRFILTGKHSNGLRISITINGEAEKRRGNGPKPKEEYVWKIATPPPNVHFIELTAETFFNALTDVLNG
jgi:hypothetical protein